MGCSICSGRSQLDRHHVVPKRMGGSRDASVHAQSNLLTLCRRCHRNVHEGGWVVSLSETELKVTDRRTGTEVMRRLGRQGFDAGAFLSGFGQIEAVRGEGLGSVAFLVDQQVGEAVRLRRAVGEYEWLGQGALRYGTEGRGAFVEGIGGG